MGARRPEMELFNIQTAAVQSLLTPGTYPVLTLPVTTIEVGQRVKLDSMVLVNYRSETTPSGSYTLNAAYELFRDNSLLASIPLGFFFVGSPLFGEVNSTYPNLTWVDVPPGPGTYNYIVVIRVTTADNFARLDALTRALNAIVFPPAL